MLRRMIARLRGRAARGMGGGDGPRIDRSVWAVGDVHGRIDALDALLRRLNDDFDASTAHQPASGPKPVLVFLGDYIDRGPRSDAVIARLQALPEERPDLDVVCLAGNHERMMLGFLDDPVQRGRQWLRHGGFETAASFGVDLRYGDVTGLGPAALRDAATTLRRALPPGTEEWLRALPVSWGAGSGMYGDVGAAPDGLLCVHAGIDPARSAHLQDEDALLWGHRDFMRKPPPDDIWVVHGHTIVGAPTVRDRRISIDTGAYRTGRLTAAAFHPADPGGGTGRAVHFVVIEMSAGGTETVSR